LNLKGAERESFGAMGSFFYRRWAEPTLSPLYRRIGAEIPIETGRLLDVGCGPGKFSRLLAAANPGLEVVGLDPSPDMIRQASRGPILPNLEFQEGAAETAGFTRLFDFAVSLLSFHHWEEPHQGLEGIYASLKPGGFLWMYEPDSEASNEDIRLDHAPLWGWLRIPGSWQRLIARTHGFSGREIDEVVRPLVAQTSFRDVEASRRGSTWRMELAR
jgi:SAM-dependent methyltransferase